VFIVAYSAAVHYGFVCGCLCVCVFFMCLSLVELVLCVVCCGVVCCVCCVLLLRVVCCVLCVLCCVCCVVLCWCIVLHLLTGFTQLYVSTPYFFTKYHSLVFMNKNCISRK
jgi:hypothetical protein